MGNIAVTLSANAGVCVDIGGKRIWVDALHSKKVPGFSTVSPALLEKLMEAPAFEKPDAICYTHDHPDHFSREMTAKAMERWPSAKVFLPQQRFAQQILLEGERPEYVLEDVKLRFLRLPHEGAQYANVIHYGLLILSSQGNVLVTGDCAVAAPELLQAVSGTELDAAILDFPWLTLNKGRTALESLNAKNILLYHLPFSEDDGNGYRDSAAKAVSRWEKGNATLLWNPLQTEIL
jgi:L-ascorbate metabolism protein UlaG (beta-lactamase superfamily)